MEAPGGGETPVTRLLTLKECAARTATTERWWRRCVFERRVAVVRLGRLVRIEEAEVERLLEAAREPARQDELLSRRRVVR